MDPKPDLLRRVEQLEREVQRWRIVGALAFLALALLAVLTQPSSQIIKTERLVVPGDGGRSWRSPGS